MHRRFHIVIAVSFALIAACAVRAQQLIDRVAARVENDIILLSDIQDLARYQKFVEGQSESDSQILDRLIDQWIVRNEASVAQYPPPAPEEVNRSLERLKSSFSSPEEFARRRKLSGLTDQDINRMLGSQLYLSNYLDSRFRPSIQIDPKAVETFYQTRVVARAESRGQQPPALEASREYIQEALTQQAINEHTDQWLKESRIRLHVERFLTDGPK
jgi:transcriptional regulator with XRE-family HTH domain